MAKKQSTNHPVGESKLRDYYPMLSSFSEQIGRLAEGLAGDDRALGFRILGESHAECRQAIFQLHSAVQLLRRAGARELPRYCACVADNNDSDVSDAAPKPVTSTTRPLIPKLRLVK
jgi:hypothetical protein